MKNKFIIITFFVIVSFATVSFGATFKGRVIDADTKEPIEGAVVVASWTEEAPTAAGSTSRLRDVKETLTDKNGEWAIKGLSSKGLFAWLRFFTSLYSIRPPVFIVFKPGYCSYPAGFGIEACKEKMKVYNFTNSDNIGEMVELPKLTNREDRKRSLPGTVGDSRDFDKKQLIFLKLISKERKNIFGDGDLENYINDLEKEVEHER